MQLGVAVAAVFPAWPVLNNAIVGRGAEIGVAAERLRSIYSAAGIRSWALWFPSTARDFAEEDLVDELGGFRRDTTTLVMQATLDARRGFDARMVRTSVATATRASEEPVPLTQVDEPAAGQLEGWALVVEGFAVSGAWSLIHDGDCGVYSVGTSPGRRRRGYARALVEGMLEDARRRGAATASLQSTAEAQSLYAGVGFRPVGRYEEWLGPAS